MYSCREHNISLSCNRCTEQPFLCHFSGTDGTYLTLSKPPNQPRMFRHIVRNPELVTLQLPKKDNTIYESKTFCTCSSVIEPALRRSASSFFSIEILETLRADRVIVPLPVAGSELPSTSSSLPFPFAPIKLPYSN